MGMKKIFKQTKEAKDLRLEIVVGLWTAVVVIILLGTIIVGSILYVKKYQKEDQKTPQATATPVTSTKPTKEPKETKEPEKTKEPQKTSDVKVKASVKPASIMYASGNVNIREKSSTESKVTGSLKKGQAVTVVEKMSNGWSQVNANGAVGYIRSDLLSSEPIYDSYSSSQTQPPKTNTSTAKPNKPKSTATPKSTKEESDVEVVVEEEEDTTQEDTDTTSPSVEPTQTTADTDLEE